VASVLITGCSTGFGKHVALLFGRQGHSVHAAVADPRAAGPMAEMAAGEGIDVAVLELDVTDAESVRDGVAVAEAASGGALDVVVNGPGIGLRGPVEVCSDDEARMLFEHNVLGPMRVVRAALPGMRDAGAGVVVNVSSIAGLVARPFGGLYSATKHALEGLTEALHHEVRPFGIRVALVEPGQFEAEQVADAAAEAGFDQSSPYWESSTRFDTAIRRLLPDGRPLPMEVVAETVVAVAFDPNAGLRHLVGADAELVMSMRTAGTFEQYDRTIRAALDWE
jgi:NAD(P)-dependent dehydrogenase (short-subunit alcohol dehydrogenase family)